jgi:hypothetical protein
MIRSSTTAAISNIGAINTSTAASSGTTSNSTTAPPPPIQTNSATNQENNQNYSQYLTQLKSKDQRIQLKAAKNFYACLINELKQVKPDNEINLIDSLLPEIRELANENNQNISDKQACIYIITSIINLDNINVKVRKKHQTSFLRMLRNLLACPDQNVIHMASRAMGKYAQAGVECDVEFKSGLEFLRIEQKRYQGILLVKELALASPSRLFLNSELFYDNIMSAICDHSAEIRHKAIELFRLSLVISTSREATILQQQHQQQQQQQQTTSQRLRRTSTNSSLSSSISNHEYNSPFGLLNNSTHNISSSANATSNKQTRDSSFSQCFRNSIRDLELLLNEITVNHNSNTRSSILINSVVTGGGGGGSSTTKEDKIHGYLLVILEIVKFSCLEFEQKIEKYLASYNLYHQQQHVTTNQVQSSFTNNHNPTSSSSSSSSSSGSCEEMHAANLLKLLPHSFFDPLHANDPFMFLFKSEKINVSIESRICAQLINEKFDQVCKICLKTIKCLNLSSNVTASTSSTNASNINVNLQPLFSSSNSNNSMSSFRCIQETILALLPRLARFDQKSFSQFYLTETLLFLTNLNNSTNFLPTNSIQQQLSSSSQQLITNSRSTNNSTQSSNILNLLINSNNLNTNNSSNTNNATNTNLNHNNVSNNNSGGLLFSGSSSLKSEVIFCVGFMSLALVNQSDEFRMYTKQFIEIIRTSPLMSSKEIQRKRLALTISSNMLNDNQSLNINPSSTSFTSNNLNQSQNNLFSTSNLTTTTTTTTTTTNISSSSNNINTISFMTQMQAAQINELNSIMACVAMFASSMVVSSQPIIIIQNSLNNVNTTLTPDSSISSSPTGEGESSGIDGTSPHSPGPSMIIHQNKMKSTTTTSVKSPTQSSSSSAIIIDSIMVLLEPLMLCSGGITFTMRYFLNEISSKIKKNYFKSLPFSSLAINGGR